MFGKQLGLLLLVGNYLSTITILAEGRLAGASDPNSTSNTCTEDQDVLLYFNKFNASTPLFRYRLWSNLTTQEQSDASNNFDYTLETWEIDPYAAIERISFLDLKEGQIVAAEAMGYNEDMWDVFINHFDDYDWEDLVEYFIDEPLIVLGWDEGIWNGPEDGYPATEDLDWCNLTGIEKQAGADLGYFQETWDKLNFTDFVETSLFLNPAAPPAETTDAPSAAPAGGGGFCFPGSARVTVEGKGLVFMDQVELGDRVLAAIGTEEDTALYETVYSFGHYDRERHHSYVQITVHGKENRNKRSTLETTPDHMIFCHKKGIIPASLVEIGDELLGAKGDRLVAQKVSSISRQGSYAPFTSSGKLVVDGILVSSYVAFQNSGYLTIGHVETPISFQWLGHSFTFPLRLYCKYWSTCTTETYTNHGISSWFDTPRRMTIWLFEQNAAILALSMAVVVTLMSVLSILEAVPMLTLALAATILGGAATIHYYCLFVAAGPGSITFKKRKSL